MTIVEAAEKLLPPMDREISQNLAMILKKRGITIYTNALVSEIQQAEGGLICHFTTKKDDKQVEADCILLSVGTVSYTHLVEQVSATVVPVVFCNPSVIQTPTRLYSSVWTMSTSADTIYVVVRLNSEFMQNQQATQIGSNYTRRN